MDLKKIAAAAMKATLAPSAGVKPPVIKAQPPSFMGPRMAGGQTSPLRAGAPVQSAAVGTEVALASKG